MSRSTSQSTGNLWTGPPPPRPLARRTYNGSAGSSMLSRLARDPSPVGDVESLSFPIERNSSDRESRFSALDDRCSSSRTSAVDAETSGDSRSPNIGDSRISRHYAAQKISAYIEEEFTVPQEDVGRIIGKRGSTIRELKATSGAEIKVDSILATVRIKGTPASVERARTSIRKIVGGDGIVMLRDVDDATLSSMTKTRTLEKLQNNLGVTVELDRRHLRITAKDGTTDTAENARQLLKERIENQVATEAVVIDLPRSQSYRQIAQSSTIEHLRDIKGLRLELLKDDKGCRLELVGPHKIVSEAEEYIESLLNGGRSRDFLPIMPELLSHCKEEKRIDLIEDIKQHVEAKCGVTVEIRADESRAVIIGTRENIISGKEKLEKVIEFYFPGNCCSVYVPRGAAYEVCEENSRLLNRMKSRDLLLTIDNESCRIWLCGTEKAVENARKRIIGQIERFESCNDEVYLDSKDVKSWIIGNRGETIRRIEDETRSRITIDEDLVVHIQSNDTNSRRAARRAITDIIHSFEMHREQSRGSGEFF